MITATQNPFLILDTAISIIKEISLESDDKSLDLNSLRLVSFLFQEIIDEYSDMLYPRFAFKCKNAYFKFSAAELIFNTLQEGQESWTQYEVLNLSRQTYQKEKITYNFFSIFSGPLVTFERIIPTERTLDKILLELKFNVPRQLFAGYDLARGSFVTGGFYYGKRKKERIFLVYPGVYREFRVDRDKLSKAKPLNGARIKFLKDLMQTGYGFHNNKKKCQWPGHKDWKEKYSLKLLMRV